MAESMIVKKKFSKAFKQLVVEIGFEKVTISKIMLAANIRRQTYYNHFQDKYDLTDWIFQQEAIEKIADNLAYEDWMTTLQDLFVYFEENKRFYCNVLSFQGQNSFQEYYVEHLKGLISKMLDIKWGDNSKKKENREFIEEFYATAFMAMTTKWMSEGCKPSGREFANNMSSCLFD